MRSACSANEVGEFTKKSHAEPGKQNHRGAASAAIKTNAFNVVTLWLDRWRRRCLGREEFTNAAVHFIENAVEFDEIGCVYGNPLRRDVSNDALAHFGSPLDSELNDCTIYLARLPLAGGGDCPQRISQMIECAAEIVEEERRQANFRQLPFDSFQVFFDFTNVLDELIGQSHPKVSFWRT